MRRIGLAMFLRYLIDTCVLSDLAKEKPDYGLKNWIKRTDRLFIPVAAIMELEIGCNLVVESDPPKYAELRSWINELATMGFRYIDTDRAVAAQLGKMMACPALRCLWVPDPKAKKPRFGQDIHIAAAAIVHNMCIASLDIHDFTLIHKYFPIPGFFHPIRNRWYVSPIL